MERVETNPLAPPSAATTPTRGEAGRSSWLDSVQSNFDLAGGVYHRHIFGYHARRRFR
jgi:hypothetical protein